MVAVLLVCNGPELLGQQAVRDVRSLADSSLASFERGDYRMALSGYRMLMDMDKGDAMYRYYAGRCLVELNEELDEAIEWLYQAGQQMVPKDNSFYLGMAYHRFYNFQEARKYYERFWAKASRQEKKDYNLKHLLATTRSAEEITSAYNPFEVMNVTFIDLHDSLQYSQVKMKGGQLGKKPEVFRVGEDGPEGLSLLMFLLSNPVRGDYQYFSGTSKSGKDGTQLFRVRKMAGNSWSAPEEISALNTGGNELLPYFDPVEEDLYFASDGHPGIGGLDLYRSHYDRERDSWSEPMNLGFPVNSAMDEYLLLPGTDLGMVMFFSNRQGTDSTVTVYRVHLSEPKKQTAVNDDKMLREIAQLGDAAGEFLAGLQSVAPRTPSIDSRPTSGDRSAGSAAGPAQSSAGTESQSAYQFYLAEALTHQARSDSLKDLADNARQRVRESDDPNDRWVWQQQIMVWEKRASDEESMADYLYEQMEEESPSGSSFQTKDPPETIEVDRVIGDLTVYRFTGSKTDNDGGSGTGTTVTVQTTDRPDVEPDASTNNFEILTHSPYNATHPIPMELNLPRGIHYRIQLGAFGVRVEPDAFGGISPVTGEQLKEKGLYKYYAGKFSHYEDASVAVPRIQSLGYEDVFIVAWYNGVQVSTQKAKQLE